MFQTEVLDEATKRVELVLSGRVYADVAPQLRDELAQAEPKHLVVNASALEQIDSSGLGVFVDLLKLIRPDGGQIVFYALNADIQRVFEITKLEQVMGVAKTRDEALQRLQ